MNKCLYIQNVCFSISVFNVCNGRRYNVCSIVLCFLVSVDFSHHTEVVWA